MSVLFEGNRTLMCSGPEISYVYFLKRIFKIYLPPVFDAPPGATGTSRILNPQKTAKAKFEEQHEPERR